MTASHRKNVLIRFPEAADKCAMLAMDSSDVLDPIRLGDAACEETADFIERAIRQRVASMVWSL